MSIISGKVITNTVTLGFVNSYPTYTSPLTITSTGAVEVSNTVDAIYSTLGGVAVFNQGLISGGFGIDLRGASEFVSNSGTIDGGSGIRANGAAGSTVINSGVVIGTVTDAVFLYGPGAYVNNVGGLIKGWLGVNMPIGGGSVVNSGTIIGTGAGGVDIDPGGSIGNTGLIEGALYGVNITGGARGAITNSGTIIRTGTSNYGSAVQVTSGGSLGNTGLIAGGRGVYIGGASSGTITNAGTILGTTGLGVQLTTSGGTIFNSGTISGGGGTAISFGGLNVRNLLVLEHGYSLGGKISGAGSNATNTLELAGSAGAAVTVGYNGLGLSHFQDLLFGPGGYETLKVSNTAGTLPVTISGFTLTSDAIDLTAIGTDGTIAAIDNVNHRVTVSGSGGSVTFQLDASDATNFATLSDGAVGTDLVLCFCRGSLILTDQGEVPVEDLKVGDRVVTSTGAAAPIEWIGFGRDHVTRSNKLSRPVIVRRGALAENVPHRDLYLTHGHALYLDGVLIPVENLVNHRSILWDETARVVEYYHLELAGHAVVLANGAAAETYYDAENRALFQNTRPLSRSGAASPSFAPVVNGGDIVERVWAELFARAGGAIAQDTTDDPDLHLVVDGRRLDPAAVEGYTYTFSLSMPPAGALTICSRSGVPSLLGISPHDHRRLGVAIGRIELRRSGIVTAFDPEARLFAEGGCHPPEVGYCWTDGVFDLPPLLFAHLSGTATLTVHTERPGMRYPIVAVLAQAA